MMWLERIIAAEERQKQGVLPFSIQDWNEAGDWRTCAVGEQIMRGAQLEVRVNGAPVDEDLITAGTNFLRAVLAQDPAGAEEWLAMVEGRTLQLKRVLYES
jgi:hypothetical protein